MNLNKVRKFLEGRRGLLPRIEAACGGVEGIIWFHVASLGEFEEARPVIEAARDRLPEAKILLTFFSPNGYETRRDWPVADWVFYLPFDTRRSMRRFFDAVRPSKAVFTIGELWPNMMREIRRRGIDASIMSVRVEEDSKCFKWYGGYLRKMLRCSFRHILVQNDRSLRLLEGIGLGNVVRTGDARVDRVLEVASQPWNDPVVDRWCAGGKVLVAGCTVSAQDDALVAAIANAHKDKKILVVPKDMAPEPMHRLIKAVDSRGALYSSFENGGEGLERVQLLIVDRIGLLSRLYRYGYAAIVGGGFSYMPHSVVEPAVYGQPVLFGPNYRRELHCVDLVALGAACATDSPSGALEWYDALLSDPAELERRSRAAADYCRSNAGATEAIMSVIFS